MTVSVKKEKSDAVPVAAIVAAAQPVPKSAPAVKTSEASRQKSYGKKDDNAVKIVEYHNSNFYEEKNVPQKIEKIEFSLLSGRDIEKMSTVEIVHDILYLEKRTPFGYGPLDDRMGTTDKAGTCGTCKQKLITCPGHFGHIRLVLPVFHLGYFKAAVTVLNCVCKSCSRLLLPESERASYLARMRSPKTDSLKRAILMKKIHDTCRKHFHCQYCKYRNGLVKKMKGMLRLQQDRYSKDKDSSQLDELMDDAKDALERNEEMESLIKSKKVIEELNPLQVLAILEAISDEDCEIMDMNPTRSRPADMMITVLPVPPCCIRPSVPMTSSAGTNEDDLTVKITEIVRSNNALKISMGKGQSMQIIQEAWLTLQNLVATYFNAEMPGAQMTTSRTGKVKPMRGFYQRLKGKMGRFRGNLSGKRVDHSGRTVISPDPNIEIDQVVVPELVAKILTYPERVTSHNMERLQQMISNGPEIYPGANHVTTSRGKTNLLFGNREDVIKYLRIGDVVERHLLDDDMVLFNRQPSLHRVSIMCHRAKILPWRTFRFNECCCTPYNADFDGDEMNLHVPQTEEARAEARELMGVRHNMVTPRNGDPLIAAMQDFLTAAWIMTRRNVFYSRSQFSQMAAYLGDAKEKIDLPQPAIFKPYPMWTGKQIFNLLLKPNKECKINVNIELEEAGYTKGRKHMCPNDGYVIFQQSELICGIVGKQVLGKETKTSVLYILMKDYGVGAGMALLSRLAKMTSRWIMQHGFTIGIEDVTPSEQLKERKQVLMRGASERCAELISDWKEGRLTQQRGCNLEQTLEIEIKKKLNSLRGEASKECMSTLHWDNKPLIMALCKSKGSEINIAQMIACVGQQVIGDIRIPDGFMGRSLPHFDVGAKIPEAKGFVENSFYSGLIATEFFFHTMAGRVGLVDTAVKTAETGYMQRRLMKALEDLSVQYDYTVKNSEGGIVQFEYGDDSLDPSLMESKEDGLPINFARLLHHHLSTIKVARQRVIPNDPGVVDPMKIDLNMPLDEPQTRAVFHSALKKFTTKNRIFRPFSLKFLSDMETFLADSVKLLLFKKHVFKFTKDCLTRYVKMIVEPGTPVGALCGQSIGEPGTQMTLKTFHFAGVESMNVTLGVPRIKEIINAAKNISTPFMEADLVSNNQEIMARIVKGRLEKTTLGDIAKAMTDLYERSSLTLVIVIDLECIKKLQLHLSVEAVRLAILATSKLKVKEKHINVSGADTLIIQPPMIKDGENQLFSIQSLKKNILNVIVSGIPTVTRAVINKFYPEGAAKEKANERFKLVVEGTGLREVMSTIGIVGTKTRTNHIMEVAKVLGIEAARATIVKQLYYTMCEAHGLKIDPRHTALLADLMSFKGEVLGITRFGIKKMKESVLMLASFEKTVDNLFDASVHSRTDSIDGVSECIIMGIPMQLGTGLFKVLQSDAGMAARAEARFTQRPKPILNFNYGYTKRLDITSLKPSLKKK